MCILFKVRLYKVWCFYLIVEGRFNPIWTGLFVTNLKGGAPSPNLAMSSQMTMKLGRDILWVKIITN